MEPESKLVCRRGSRGERCIRCRLLLQEEFPVRLRTARDKLKIEHSIIDGVRDRLERLLSESPDVRSVVPGVIKPVRDAKGEPRVRITVPTTNGWKGIALSG